MNPTCKDCGKEMKCEDCRYWVRTPVDQKQNDGECRVEPPQVLLMPMPTKVGLTPGLTVNGFFPRTRTDLWCGKFLRLSVVSDKSNMVEINDPKKD
jgi:hypothetical protein